MTLYVLDSDTVRLLNDRHPSVLARFYAVAVPDRVTTTAITVHEAVIGWHSYILHAKTDADTERGYSELCRAVRGFSDVDLLNYTQAAVQRFNQLLKLKLNIGRNDLRIAAIALEAGGIVVTRNLRDFRRVPGLSCEDWSV